MAECIFTLGAKAMAMLSQRRAASIDALMSIKDVTRDDAKKIRHAWQTVSNRREAREAIDALLHTCGVEYLGWHKRSNCHVYYCNAGDTYAPTILFCGLSMRVGCWGDMVERNLINDGTMQ